jgi:hypothetical protein
MKIKGSLTLLVSFGYPQHCFPFAARMMRHGPLIHLCLATRDLFPGCQDGGPRWEHLNHLDVHPPSEVQSHLGVANVSKGQIYANL